MDTRIVSIGVYQKRSSAKNTLVTVFYLYKNHQSFSRAAQAKLVDLLFRCPLALLSWPVSIKKCQNPFRYF